MNTEEFIRKSAARGWSKTQTREVLGLSSYKFWAMLDVMPAMQWAPRGQSLGHRQNNASRKGKAPSPALLAAVAKAAAVRREKHLKTWQGRTGTVAELSAFSEASPRTITRRLKEGMSVEEAFSTPPRTKTPDAGWRITK